MNLGDLSKDEFERFEASEGKRALLEVEDAEEVDDDEEPSRPSVAQIVERFANESKGEISIALR